MPTGKVKFLDTERGFGFVGDGDGAEVFLHASALSEGATTSKPGTRVEYGVVNGRKGPQALTVEISSPIRSVSTACRCKSQAIVPVAEDLIKLLGASSTALYNGKYSENSRAIAKAPRAVADDFDV